jgi:putative transferase (TIGR04331 family)
MSDIWTAERLFFETRQIESEWPGQIDWLSQVITELSQEQCTAREAGLLAGFWLLHFVHQVRVISADETPIEQACKGHVTINVAESRRSQLLADLTTTTERRRVDDLIRIVWKTRALPENLALLPLADENNLTQADKTSKLKPLLSHLRSLSGKKVLFADSYLKIGRAGYLNAVLSTWPWATWHFGTDDALSVTPILDVNLRLALARSITISSVSDLTKALIPLLIPHGYCENRRDVRRQVLSGVPCQPKALHTATGLQMSLTVQHLAATWGTEGTLITTHQHGGHTGLDHQHVLEDLEVSLSDFYYTFGWTDSRPNVRPLAIPPPRGRAYKARNSVLLMSLESAPFFYRLQPFCIPDHVTKCLEESRRFLSSLNAEVDISIRAKQHEQLVLKSSNLAARLTDVVGSGPSAASKFGLVVHNYLGTSWLETLAMDMPTVCFIPRGIHKFRAAAQPFADALVRVGVLHYSGLEAAKFVNALRGDPTAWWRSAEVQEAREAFVARYANFSDNWLSAWTQEFERLLS